MIDSPMIKVCVCFDVWLAVVVIFGLFVVGAKLEPSVLNWTGAVERDEAHQRGAGGTHTQAGLFPEWVWTTFRRGPQKDIRKLFLKNCNS